MGYISGIMFILGIIDLKNHMVSGVSHGKIHPRYKCRVYYSFSAMAEYLQLLAFFVDGF